MGLGSERVDAMEQPRGAPLFFKNFPKIKLNSHERSGELFRSVGPHHVLVCVCPYVIVLVCVSLVLANVSLQHLKPTEPTLTL